MTIDEALNQNLNFSMLNDVYIRISENQQEIVSYELSDYYSNVTSMIVGKFTCITDSRNLMLSEMASKEI